MTDLNAALVKQFLDVPVTQGKTVVQPHGVLDDRHRESVSVRFRVSHGGSAYPDPVKATQPSYRPWPLQIQLCRQVVQHELTA